MRAKMDTLMEELKSKEKSLKRAKDDTTKRERMRVKRAKSSLEEEAINGSVALGKEVMWEKVVELISDAGGISRLTIYNDDWHEKHPNAAQLLFGYRNWKETKLYVKAYFPELDVTDPSQLVITTKEGDLKMPYLSQFENCLLVRMFFHIFSHQQIIALCVDRHRTRIGQILKVWAPKWANVGEDLSCLDITADYLYKETPNLHIDVGKSKLVYVDGKDWTISTKKNDNTVSKSTFSSKNDGDGARCLTYSTAAGQVFERTRLFGARVGEKALQRFWGSLGPANAPVEEWEDVARTDPAEDEHSPSDYYWTALEEAMSAKEYNELLKRIDDGDPLLGNGAVDDGVLVTGQPTALAQERLNADNMGCSDSSDAEDEETAPSGTAKYAASTSRSAAWYQSLLEMKKVDNAKEALGCNKKLPVLTPELLKEVNQKLLRNDPNMSGRRKLLQLERHQRLHLLYEAGELHKCLLSYFLLVVEPDRLKMLSWMGSDLAGDTPKPNLEELPKIPLRLAKIPENWGVGGDKGFDDTSGDFPNVNDVETPVKINNSKKEQLSAAQILSEVPITIARAGCETIFRRVDGEAIMKAKIPYWLIPFLPHGHALAHGEANLEQPLRRPGRYAIVGEDYWANVKEYIRYDQQSQEARDVQTSARRVCKRCKEAGEVRICNKCNKWYHDNGNCHDFGRCNPGPVLNPYE